MKRSEMIKLMFEVSESFKGSKTHGDFYDRFFDAILTKQEDAGMMPPTIDDESPYNQCPNCCWHLDNEWESESDNG